MKPFLIAYEKRRVVAAIDALEGAAAALLLAGRFRSVRQVAALARQLAARLS